MADGAWATTCRSLTSSLVATQRLKLTKTPLEKMPIQDVWKEYKKSPSIEVEKYLMTYYLPLVNLLATSYLPSLPNGVEVHELVALGMQGLNDAIKNFELERGLKFESFAGQRILGSMKDGLRGQDWVPRVVRERDRIRTKAKDRFYAKSGRNPSPDEWPELYRDYFLSLIDQKIENYKKNYQTKNRRKPTDLEIQTKRQKLIDNIPNLVEKMMKEPEVVGTLSIESSSPGSKDSSSGEPTTLLTILADPTDGTLRMPSVLMTLQRKDLIRLLTQGLSRAERLIVIMYYFEEATMREIGAAIGISESRISQMHRSILERVKASLSDRSDEFLERLDP